MSVKSLGCNEMRFFWYRDLTLREKAYLALILAISNAIGSLLLAQKVSKYYLVAFFLGIFVFGLFKMSLKCPHCGAPIMKNEIFIFGYNTHMWKPVPVKHCSECGTKID